MQRAIDLVKEFHDKVHQSSDPSDYRRVYRTLVAEEAAEVDEAAGSLDLDAEMGLDLKVAKEALLEESADVIIVLMGQLLASGIDVNNLTEAVARKAQANLSKFDDNGLPIFRDDGKVLKGPNYQPASMEGLV